MKTNRFFNLVMALIFAISLFETPAPVSAQEYYPTIQVWDSGRVDGIDWPQDSPIKLTIEDPTTPQSPDFMASQTPFPCSSGPDMNCVNILTGNFQFAVGQIITLTDVISYTKVFTITSLNMKVTNIDPQTDTVSGTADPNSSLTVAIGGIPDNQSRYVTADDSGNWITNFGIADSGESIYDIITGTNIYTAQCDEDGDCMSTGDTVSALMVKANFEMDNIQAWGPEEGTSITLSIDDPDTGPGEDYSATLNIGPLIWDPNQLVAMFELDGVFDVLPGQVITISGDLQSRSMTVANIWGVNVDLQADTVSGYVAAGVPASISVGIDNVHTDGFNADTNGYWLADIGSLGGDIKPGSAGYVQVDTPDGSTTWTSIQIANPGIAAFPNEDQVEGYQWPLGSVVNIEIDDADTPENPDYTTSATSKPADWDPNGTYFQVDFRDVFDLQPGHLVTVSDGNITKQHTVTHLAVTSINIVTDTVSGIANPGSSIHVGTICDEAGCADRYVTTDENGNWLANFSIPVSDPSQGFGVVDLRLTSMSRASEYDEDWDETKVNWNVTNPIIRAGVDNDRVLGMDWPLGATVNFEIDDPLTQNNPDYTHAITVEVSDWDPNTWFVFYTNNYDLKPGDIVTATDGNTTKQLIVSNFKITAVDVDTDTVYGIADPGQGVRVWTYDQNDTSISRLETTDQDGNWSANFAIPGDEDSEQGTIDIRNGSYFDSFVSDEDWDATGFMWWVPNPYFDVRANWDQVGAWEWPLGATLTLEIDDPATPDEPDFSTTQVVNYHPEEPRTYAEFNVGESIDIQAGFEVSLSDGTTTKNLTVSPLSFTSVDIDSDKVYGVADPEVQVGVWACDGSGCYNYHTTSDSFGAWTVDMTQLSDQGAPFDIVGGTWIDSEQRNEYSDSTMYGWTVPNPYFEVRANADSVEAFQWPMGSTITLEIDDPGTDLDPDYSVTRLVDEMCPWDPNMTYERFEVGSEIDIQPGFLIRITDGVTTKAHTVAMLALTDFNAETNVVTGVAAAGSSVDIWTCDEFGCYNPDPNPVADENGIWAYDFTGIYDIVPGTWIDTSQFDEDGDGTLYGQNVPTPRFKVVLDEKRIYGYEWMDGAFITVTVDDPVTPQNPDFIAEQIAVVTSPDPEQPVVIFDVGGLTLRPGMLVTMTDGTTTKTHIILDYGWTSIDYDNDVISGWGQASMDTVIWTYNEIAGGARRFLSNEDGSWTASFAEPGDEDWETVFDIQPGMSGGMSQIDADRDETIRQWSDIGMAINQPPVAEAGGPYSGKEGFPISLNASTSTDPDNNIATYAWDLDGDGQFDDATGPKPKYAFPDNGIYTIRVLVTDQYGLQDIDEATVTVKNVAPVITFISIPSIVRAGSLATFFAKFMDAGANDTFTATWNWGDKTTSVGVISGNQVTGSHTYKNPGIYLVTITVKDDDGGIGKSYAVVVVIRKR